MDVAFDDKIARALKPSATIPFRPRQGEMGTSSGINIAPGSDDDGWTVPHPINLSDGTRIQLHKDGEALHAAYEAIRNAKFRICLEVYIFASDATGRAFADLLCNKAEQGVQVYVIYDSFGSINSEREMFRKMKRSGVHVQQFHPIWPWECQYGWRPVNRDHRKILVIDNDLAGLGGLNVGAEYAGSWVVQPSGHGCCDIWRDTAIGVAGPGARYFLRSFANTWRYIQRGGRIRKTELIHNLEDGDFGVMASSPTTDSTVTPFAQKLFREAKKSIKLTMAYFAPPDELITELCRAARRGVKVQLMLPGKCDVRLLLIAARSFYEELMSNGVEVFERQAVVLHAKTLVIDEMLSVVGSTNLDYRSIEYNCEVSAIVRSAEFGKQMSDLFENDVQFAKRISLKEWRRRPTLDRVVQWGVSRTRYLL